MSDTEDRIALASLAEEHEFWQDVSQRLKALEAPADDHTAHHELVMHRTIVRQHLEKIAPLHEAAQAAFGEV